MKIDSLWIVEKNMKKLLSVFLFLAVQTTISATTIPKLDHLGTLEFEMSGFYLADKYKMIADFGPGKITFNDGGSGKVKVCTEFSDFIANDKQTIALNVTCRLMMSDNSALYLEYYGRIVPDKNWGKNIESGKSLVKNDGVQNWFTGISLRTTSKKYGYLNNLLLLGKGKKLRNPSKDKRGLVSYDLYKPNY